MSEDVLRLTRVVDASPAEVWGCLTRPDCFKSWWREHLEFEARQGGRFVEPWVDPTGRNRVTRAQVTAFHPPRGLVMVWADDDWSFDTVVSISIVPTAEGGSEVEVEHQGWHAAPVTMRGLLMDDHSQGWNQRLADLAEHAEAHIGKDKGKAH
ncbi:SRPBCC family protein [Mangrovibrevibacter kandeliae]|uniref:SRPBCC family protein n=1 Tax=Mangrovibrevibacter kandeliae TaxID=2968473 RepID=UPI0021186B4E|nr:SRPBCC domain-containing protein [Aurantimonas sp. CSK15Z-1]